MITTVLIVDDEQGARDVLAHLIRKLFGEQANISQAEGITDALEHLEKGAFDYLFLDIRLKQGNGFDILRRAPHHNFNLIFTTAYDEYALQAFQYSAVDYVLKPIALADLELSMQRLAARQRNLTTPIKLLEEMMEAKAPEKILLPTAKGEEVFNLSDVVRVQASGNYSVFHFTNGRTLTVAKTLKVYDELFSGNGFFRVHQSHLVNTNMIKKVMRSLSKTVLLTDGTSVPVSRRQLPKLKGFLEG